MADSIHWIVEMVVEPGRLAEFKALMAEMVESARAEPGVTDYEWFVAEDGRSVSIHERYKDAPAAKAHSAKFRAVYAKRFFELAKPARFVFYGRPSDEMREAIKAPVLVLDQIGGFTRGV